MAIHTVTSAWSFQPTRKPRLYGDKTLEGIRVYKEPGIGTVLSAQLTIGLDVVRKYKLREKDIIEAVKNHRIIQAGDPGATFMAGKGLYKAPGSIIEEEAIQVIIKHLTDESPEEFRANAKDLGEFLATVFGQDSVLVEVFINNVLDEVVGATRNPMYMA